MADWYSRRYSITVVTIVLGWLCDVHNFSMLNTALFTMLILFYRVADGYAVLRWWKQKETDYLSEFLSVCSC